MEQLERWGKHMGSLVYKAERAEDLKTLYEEKRANMDAISAARSFGIRADRAVRYRRDSVGTALNYSVVSETVARVRRRESIESDWSAPIEADVKKRGE